MQKEHTLCCSIACWKGIASSSFPLVPLCLKSDLQSWQKSIFAASVLVISFFSVCVCGGKKIEKKRNLGRSHSDEETLYSEWQQKSIFTTHRENFPPIHPPTQRVITRKKVFSTFLTLNSCCEYPTTQNVCGGGKERCCIRFSLPWKNSERTQKTTSKFCLLLPFFCCFRERVKMFGWLVIFTKRTHIIVGRTEEKMLPCHCVEEKIRGNFFLWKNYICVVAETFFSPEWDFLCGWQEKMKGKLIRKENISWNKKWKCKFWLWLVSWGSFNASIH